MRPGNNGNLSDLFREIGCEELGGKAVFLDRDGTINREVNYLHRVEDLELLPGVAEAIRTLNELDFLVFIITNQSGIARGYFTYKELNGINTELLKLLNKKGAGINSFYHCPHHPHGKVAEFAVDCKCRKPAAGLFLLASDEFEIDFERSFAIGDRIRDIEPAIKLGSKGILVKTGYGKEELKSSEKWSVKPAFIAGDLPEAVNWILNSMEKKNVE